MPLNAKVIATRGFKVDKQGDIRGKGHATRDTVEWMLPPLWPWKIITLPARGPRPTLKGETVLLLRVMDDVQLPQVATLGPDWHFFGEQPPSDTRAENDAYRGSLDNNGAAAPSRRVIIPASSEPAVQEVPRVNYASYATAEVSSADQHFYGTGPGVPVFVLKTGSYLVVGNYTYENGRTSYELASGGKGVIDTSEVDWTTTTRVNEKRGVRVTLRSGPPSAGDGSF